jgi:hypothetical protein
MGGANLRQKRRAVEVNDEARMTNDEGTSNAQMTKSDSSFVIPSSLGIRHSSFFVRLSILRQFA